MSTSACSEILHEHIIVSLLLCDWLLITIYGIWALNAAWVQLPLIVTTQRLRTLFVRPDHMIAAV